jgi:hypothetical protein
VGVIPALAVTVIRGRWLYFWCGWLTLGILWFVGAFAGGRDDPPPNPRTVAAILAAAVSAVLVFGLFGARPSPVLGLNGGALQGSVGGALLDSHGCRPQPGGAWMCSRYDEGGSGTVSYVVRANGLGCWHATRVGGPGEGSSQRLSGCVTLYDYAFWS